MGRMMELNGHPVTVEELGPLGLCNYGHFTSMRVEDMRVRGLDLHLDRLAHDSWALFASELDTEHVRHLARRAASAIGTTAVVRVTLFDPEMELGRPSAAKNPQILVTTRPAAAAYLPPLRLATVRYNRDLANVKHVGLFGTLQLRRTAQLDGYDDVLFVDSSSHVSEVATSNIAFLHGDRVVWPEADWLPGVTMRLIQDIMSRTGIPFDISPVEADQIPQMRSALITNAAVGLRSVATIDRHELTEDVALLALLRKEYAELPGDPL